MKYPKIYLVMDNCFAIKRWVEPREWMKICKDLGTPYLQASCDNEVDPLYNPKDFRMDWLKEVQKQEQELGVKVVNFYTGYQTYRTVGLASDDERVVNKLLDGWFSPMLELAQKLDAGLGFYMVALVDKVLQDPAAYQTKMAQIIDRLAEVAKRAQERGVLVGLEQMYNPSSPPWTIEGNRQMLIDIYKKGAPFYTTIDVGHMVGQDKFLRPDAKKLRQAIENKERVYVGSTYASQVLKQALQDEMDADKAMQIIEHDMAKHDYLFSEQIDGDPYAWLSELGCYSPIMHLQQTDGHASRHAAFTRQENKNGIIKGDKVLQAIKQSYENADEANMPPKVDAIYLNFEIFASNTETSIEVLEKLRESVEYWRQFIPKDGMTLDQLV